MSRRRHGKAAIFQAPHIQAFCLAAVKMFVILISDPANSFQKCLMCGT